MVSPHLAHSMRTGLGGVAAAELTTNLNNRAPDTGTIAAAGSNQGNAAALSGTSCNVVTGADGTKGVILPTPSVGQEVEVINTNGASALKVYADSGGTGGTINGGSGNASVNLAASKGTIYRCTAVNPTAWWSLGN